jgi:general secretion pathway protein G
MSHLETRDSGFTLIELLLVITIVGILGALGMGGLVSSREKSRDSARIADVQMVAAAIGMYYGTCYQYPANLNLGAANGCPSGTSLATFIPSIPLDPFGTPYDYATSGGGNTYDAAIVRATLEQDRAELANDVDGVLYKNASLDCDDSPNKYFCIGS